MQWSITGTLFEPDGKAASGQVEIQTFELARSQWRSVAKARLDAKGNFAINLNLGDGPQLPAVRLCETVKARETPRVLAEGALVQVEPASESTWPLATLSGWAIRPLPGASAARPSAPPTTTCWQARPAPSPN
ncbi:hypothetical protein ULF88_09490 [Halopseudomonas pachastrellae]|nr:hypothetical protein [Halopseudomonas pachastrellae]